MRDDTEDRTEAADRIAPAPIEQRFDAATLRWAESSALIAEALAGGAEETRRA